MMKKTLLFFVFLIVNFGGLYLGAILMGSSPGSNTWYNNLQKAPWTPPGYFFGIAWTILLCFCFTFIALFLFSYNKFDLDFVYFVH